MPKFVILHRNPNENKHLTHMIQRNLLRCLLVGLAATVGLASCIQEEALNAECDIVAVDSAWLHEQVEAGLIVGTPVVRNNSVNFYVDGFFVNPDEGLRFAPRFALTPGATLTPESGTELDFTEPQVYTTRSEDGAWSKQYTVSFNLINSGDNSVTDNGFEHAAISASGQYYEFSNVGADGSGLDCWDSGNAGFLFTGLGRTPLDYPTYPDADGYRGQCVSLVTRTTGTFGDGVGMPIAAGNLFIGEFRANQAMLAPRLATRFGMQLVKAEPLYLEGWYKYTAGEVVINQQKEVMTDMRDTCDIYAVLYEVDPQNFVPLNGDDVLTSERIVSIARIADPGEPQEWTSIHEPFRYVNGKSYDPARAADNGYAITIVMTSSRQGAYFCGAVGSHLMVDEIRIRWNETAATSAQNP